MNAKYKLEEHIDYNFGRAETEVHYSLWRWEKRFLRKPKWYRVTHWYMGHDLPVQGNKDWAERIAKDLKIDMPLGYLEKDTP